MQAIFELLIALLAIAGQVFSQVPIAPTETVMIEAPGDVVRAETRLAMDREGDDIPFAVFGIERELHLVHSWEEGRPLDKALVYGMTSQDALDEYSTRLAEYGDANHFLVYNNRVCVSQNCADPHHPQDEFHYRVYHDGSENVLYIEFQTLLGDPFHTDHRVLEDTMENMLPYHMISRKIELYIGETNWAVYVNGEKANDVCHIPDRHSEEMTYYSVNSQIWPPLVTMDWEYVSDSTECQMRTPSLIDQGTPEVWEDLTAVMSAQSAHWQERGIPFAVNGFCGNAICVELEAAFIFVP